MVSEKETAVVDLVKSWVISEDKDIAMDFLTLLNSDNFHQDDMFGKSIVRYIFFLKKFPLTENKDSLWTQVLNKYFDSRQGREPVTTKKYINTTTKIINEAFGVEIPEPEETPTKTKKMVKSKS